MTGGLHRVLLAGILCLGISSTLFAQQPAITANIPFDFYVGSTLVHAGQYVIESPRGGMQILRNKDTKVSVASIPTIVVRAPEPFGKGTLVFNCYGINHFLSQIFWAGASDGREIIKHGLEAEFARTIPGIGTTRVLGSQN